MSWKVFQTRSYGSSPSLEGRMGTGNKDTVSILHSEEVWLVAHMLYLLFNTWNIKHECMIIESQIFVKRKTKTTTRTKKNNANIFKTRLIYIVRCPSLLGSGFSPLFSSFHSHWCCYLMKACWSCQWRELSISSWQCLCSLRQSRDTE